MLYRCGKRGYFPILTLMMGRKLDSGKASAPKGDIQWMQATPSLAWFAPWSLEFLPGALNRAALELKSPPAEDSYYNLLVQGFRAGQLNMKREAPPGLAQLADPYDPAVNAAYIVGYVG